MKVVEPEFLGDRSYGPIGHKSKAAWNNDHGGSAREGVDSS